MLNVLSVIIIRATSLTNGVFIKHIFLRRRRKENEINVWNDVTRRERSKQRRGDVHINMFHVVSFYWDTVFSFPSSETSRGVHLQIWKYVQQKEKKKKLSKKQKNNSNLNLKQFSSWIIIISGFFRMLDMALKRVWEGNGEFQ